MSVGRITKVLRISCGLNLMTARFDRSSTSRALRGTREPRQSCTAGRQTAARLATAPSLGVILFVSPSRIVFLAATYSARSFLSSMLQNHCYPDGLIYAIVAIWSLD